MKQWLQLYLVAVATFLLSTVYSTGVETSIASGETNFIVSFIIIIYQFFHINFLKITKSKIIQPINAKSDMLPK